MTRRVSGIDSPLGQLLQHRDCKSKWLGRRIQRALLLVASSCCYNRCVLTALKSRTTLLVLIVFSVWSIRSSGSPHASTPVLRQQFTERLVAAAIERTHHSVRYVPAYVRIAYPNGDVPADSGVCTDEIIRSYRA